MRDVANIVFGAILSALISVGFDFSRGSLHFSIDESAGCTFISLCLLAAFYGLILRTVEAMFVNRPIKGYWQINLVSGINTRSKAMAMIGYKRGRLLYEGWGLDDAGFIGSHWNSETNNFVENCIYFNASASIYKADGTTTLARNHGQINFIGDRGRLRNASGHFIDIFGDGTFRHYTMRLTRITRSNFEQALESVHVSKALPGGIP